MIKRIEEIKERCDKNRQVLMLVASYLNNFPSLVSCETIQAITLGKKENEEKAFCSFLSNVFFEDEKMAKAYEREYFSKSIKELSPEEYLHNPFFENIKIPTMQNGGWSLGYQTYAPYEGFIYRDIQKEGDYIEIPQIGYFPCEFTYPTVYENGVEWMAIKPNEIETMKEPIKKAEGSVLVYGLGIGYFAYMVSQKDEVRHVTVVERDQNAIALFKEYILPQFPNRDKIEIINADALEYAEKEMERHTYTYVFTDLWHDVSDGVDLYIRMKKFETKCRNTRFEYWIEDSILSSIRWSIFDGIYNRVKSNSFQGTIEDIEMYLTDEYLKAFVKFI